MRKILKHIIPKLNKVNKRVLFMLAALVVFITTYMMILPVISLDKQAAFSMPGIEIEKDNQEEIEKKDEIEPTESIQEDASESVPKEEWPDTALEEDKREIFHFDDVDIVCITNPHTKALKSIKEKKAKDALFAFKISLSEKEKEDVSEDVQFIIQSKDIDNTSVKLYAVNKQKKKELEYEETSEGLAFSLQDSATIVLKQKGDEVKSQNSPNDKSKNTASKDSDGVKKEYLQGEQNAGNKEYSVSAKIDAKSKISSDADLYIKPVDSKKEYTKKAEKLLSGKEIKSLTLYDIGFSTENQEIEPVSSIEMTLQVKDKIEGELIHFVDGKAELVDADFSYHKNETSITFQAEHFSVYGIAEVVLEDHVLTDDGKNYHITVNCPADSGIPQNASLQIKELTGKDYDKYLEKSAEAMKVRSFQYAHVFDISILNERKEEIQPAAPVYVSIKLDDRETSDKGLSVLHFASEQGNPEEMDISTKDGTISFYTEGFSAYAIVQGPEAVAVGCERITSLEELDALASNGLYIGHVDGFFFMNTLTKDSKRTGITKTKPATVSPPSNAAKYYFEKAANSKYYAYCYVNGEKKYVKNTGNNSLSLADENEKTAFTISCNSDGIFTVKNGAWYWNMQGGANGARFCSYNTEGDVNNNLYFWKEAESDNDPYSLNGRTYGLMNWNGGAAGKALMGEETVSALPMTVMSKKTDSTNHLFVPNNSEITMWTFQNVDGDNYYLTTTIDGEIQYLTVNNGSLSLTNTADEQCIFKVIPGTGIHAGEISLKSSSGMVSYSGDIDDGFILNGDAGTEWLYLVQKSELTSDYFMSYSAIKTSISNEEITTGSKIILYIRKWNAAKKRYELFAIDHDGTLVPCFESGDSIEWVGSNLNTLLWQFTEYTNEDGTPNYYYELYNEYSGKYLSPCAIDGNVFSDEPIGINMNGRKDEQYYSTILSWDDEKYSYAGLKVDNDQLVSAPMKEAIDFYFAIVENIEVDDKLHTVKTLNNQEHGITMKMINFDTRAEMSNYLGNDELGQGTTLHQGLLSNHLNDDGYPMAQGGSLGQLYAGAQEVNHLFIDNIYQGTGYFEFDSTQNFATLNQTTRDFKVYKELGSYDSGGNKVTLKHGQFFPFNDIEPGLYASVNGKNLYTAEATPIPDGNPRKNEHLYLIKNTDCYFGMELEASFVQTPSGLDNWGHDIIYEFTGDDDFWLYVDGELVLDLGGIHSAAPGNVNFRTGEVNITGQHTTLKDIFYNNCIARGKTPQQAQEYVDSIFIEKNGKWIFKDYTPHTMRIFYMERGAGASNLHMRFNLASIKPGTVELSKKLSGVDDTESVPVAFPYQIKYRLKDGTEHYLSNKVKGNSTKNKDYVFYKNTVKPVSYKESKTIDGVEYNDVFMLRPNEKAVISFPVSDTNETIESYSIIECGVNNEVFDTVTVNGDVIDGTTDAGVGTYPENRMDYGIDFDTTDNRASVSYVNEVNPDALRTLTIKKRLFDEYGLVDISAQDTSSFNFRLYLGTEFDESLELADMYSYHVKDNHGNYCIWDANQKKFTSIEKSSFSSLTESEKNNATFITSMNGAISKIPAGYTIEIRNVLAGTNFKVVERSSEIPDGYSFQKYAYYDPADSSSMTEFRDAEDGVSDVIVSDHDSHVDVCNLKGWGLRMNKTWEDQNYMTQRDDVYFAVFVKDNNQQYTMIENTMRKLNQKENSLYWYFPHLPIQAPFEQYVVRELKLENPTIDDNNYVTHYDSMQILEDNDEMILNGLQKGESQTGSYTYHVHYENGALNTDSNVYTIPVSNLRPGIEIIKQDEQGHPLSNATFTLSNSSQLIGTFTSDENGTVTKAFLKNHEPYILQETKSPDGYLGLQEEIQLQWENGNLEISGIDEEEYTLIHNTGDMPKLILKNHAYSFHAIKKDAQTNQPLQGVKFALYKQHTVDGVVSINPVPIPGYENLITDENGIIPSIDHTLSPGTYELREKQTLTGYQLLTDYIRFTISKTGKISLQSDLNDVSLRQEKNNSEQIEYTLTVLNSQKRNVRFKKVDIANVMNSALANSKFALYETEEQNGTMVRKASPLYPVLISDNTGFLKDNNGNSTFSLSPGTYHLIETEAPAGYVKKASPVIVSITSTDVIYDEGTTLSQDGRGKTYDNNTKTYTLKISNSTGYELPETGGLGTTWWYWSGGMLILLAAALKILLRKKILFLNHKK